jgi:hypothetical protein
MLYPPSEARSARRISLRMLLVICAKAARGSPSAAQEEADCPRRQLRLHQESGRQAFCDQLGIVDFGARGDQDHFSVAFLTVDGPRGRSAH